MNIPASSKAGISLTGLEGTGPELASDDP